MKTCKGCGREFNPTNSPFDDFGPTCGRKAGAQTKEEAQINEEYCGGAIRDCVEFLKFEDPKPTNFDNYRQYMEYLSELVEPFYQGNFNQAEIDYIADSYRVWATDLGYCSEKDWEDYYSGKDFLK